MQHHVPYSGGAVNYEPNTLGGGMPKEAQSTATVRAYVEGDMDRRKISFIDDFAQAGERYRGLSMMHQDHLVDNIVDLLGKADLPIQKRMVENLTKADAELGSA
jgi:catalase